MVGYDGLLDPLYRPDCRRLTHPTATARPFPESVNHQ
jgi:hypothetical protein